MSPSKSITYERVQFGSSDSMTQKFKAAIITEI